MRELIHAAAESGADCVKTQWIYAEEILPANTGSIRLPTGDLDIYKQFLELETSPDFYAEMKELCESLGLDWSASPFGLKSAAELLALKPLWVKIASPEINHFPLLQYLDQSGIPLILSTGVSKLSDIKESLQYIKTSEVGLMHCITSYPAPEEEYNISVIYAFEREFGLTAGLSDHSLSPIELPLLAASVGARFLEKHFTLDKSDGGMDDPIALIPKEFQKMVDIVREYEGQTPTQKPLFLSQIIPKQRQKILLGDGNKRLSPAEEANYLRTNRSIHATRDIEAGDFISLENSAILRTEKILRPGLHPRYWASILGKKAKKKIPYGQGIRNIDLQSDL
jgi:sialic acid synthase SpsE